MNSPGIFVVEQDPDTGYQVQQTIAEAGYTLAGRTGLGTEAVSRAAALQPDMILCAFREPLTRAIHTIEALAHVLPDTPIVVYSEDHGIDVARKAMLTGARDFLRAPVRSEDLKRSLDALLQREERKHLRASGVTTLDPEGAIVTIFGAKGGVGKTTLAANLAVALVQRAGQSVALVDADDTFGDAADALALTPEQTVADAMRRVHEVPGDGQTNGYKDSLTMHQSGLAVLATPRSPLDWRDLAPDQLKDLIRGLAREYDLVVVDTGGNLGTFSQAAIEAASLVLWITTPEYASVRDSLEALEVLDDLHLADDRIRVVLNHPTSDVEVGAASVEEALGRQIFWTVPNDPLLRQSAQTGQPLFEVDAKSPAAQNLADLALLISGAPRPTRNGGLLRRLIPRRRPRQNGQPAAVEMEGSAR